MSQIANTIYQAIVSHTTWKKRLHDIIDAGVNEYDVDARRCGFGKWLKENAEQLSLYEHYQHIVNLHSQFHQDAEKIIQLALEEKWKEASKAIEYGSDFDHLSQELVKNLIAWHDIVIGKK
jgi:hypothetical protein